MSSHSESDRETRRALLREALDQLRDAPDDRSADDIVRALDAYLDARVPDVGPDRPRVQSDLDRNERHEIRWVVWMILGVALLATLVVATTIDGGGWPVGLSIVAIWIVAGFAMLNT